MANDPKKTTIALDPATIALLLRGILDFLPSLIQSYNIAKGKDNFSAEERAELDGRIASHRDDPVYQE